MKDQEKMKLLSDTIENFKRKNILVIGDAILDENIHGKAIGTVLESPETKKLEHEKTERSFGGAGNVVENLLKLGAKTTLITLLGVDEQAKHYKNWSHDNLKLISIQEEGRKTITKTKFWSGKENVFKINRQTQKDLSKESEEKIFAAVEEEIKNTDIVLLVDYRHGLFSQSLIEKIIKTCKENGKEMIVNSQVSQKESNHLNYKGCGLMFLNLKEAKLIDPSFTKQDEGKNLRNKLNSDLCVTFGKDGAALYFSDKRIGNNFKEIKEVDSTGAGDAFLAALAASDFRKNPEIALNIANKWAALCVQKIGTVTPELSELNNLITQ